MTTYTPAQVREFAEDMGSFPFMDADEVIRSLADQVEALEASNTELERLNEKTYVALGADAYNHATECMEAWQAERIAQGKDPGTTYSLCDGMAWLYEHIDELEAQLAAVGAGGVQRLLQSQAVQQDLADLAAYVPLNLPADLPLRWEDIFGSDLAATRDTK